MWEGPWAAPALTETEIKLCVPVCVWERMDNKSQQEM